MCSRNDKRSKTQEELEGGKCSVLEGRLGVKVFLG